VNGHVQRLATPRASGCAVVGGNQTLQALGRLAVDDVAGARRCLEVAADSPLHLESTAFWLEALAAVSLAEGDVERSATAYGAAEALRERTGIQMWPIMRMIFASRLGALDDAGPEVEAARFAGRQMSPGNAMARLLGRPLGSVSELAA
jgi:hypothetical protein